MRPALTCAKESAFGPHQLFVRCARTVAMAAISSPIDEGTDGQTSDHSSARGSWITQWIELLFWPWRELPAVMRSVGGQLIAMAGRSVPEEVAARIDAIEVQMTGWLEQTEIHYRRELDDVRVATAALERRVAALEAQARQDAPENDGTDVPRLPVLSPDAFRKVLSRAGEVAARRGLTTGAASATVLSDRGVEMHANADGPAQPPQKTPRSRGRRA